MGRVYKIKVPEHGKALIIKSVHCEKTTCTCFGSILMHDIIVIVRTYQCPWSGHALGVGVGVGVVGGTSYSK